MKYYRLRFFFEASSGICFWADDSETTQALGYTVDLNDLPLADELKNKLRVLMHQYDENCGLDGILGEIRFDRSALQSALRSARNLLPMIRESLGPQFKISDELGSLDSDETISKLS